jgi:pyruvate formate lyase activating enzyme
MTIEIKGFIQNTLIDWEGTIASIIFLPNCNFNCPYCHSAALVKNSSILDTIDKSVVINFLKQKKKWIDGLVITGGEPTIYQELPSFIKEFKDIGIKIKLDTNGSNPDMLENLIKNNLIDYVAMDIKAPIIKEKYNVAAGVEVNLENIKKSKDILMNSNIDYEFRTTFSKAWLTKEDLLDIAELIKGAKRWRLQKFKLPETGVIDNNIAKDVIEFTAQEIEENLIEFKKYVLDCKVR